MKNYDNLLLISEKDLRKAKTFLEKGIVIDPSVMDWMDIYACFCIAGATGTQNKLHLTCEIKDGQARDLGPELPCEYILGDDIRFTLL